VEVDVATLEEPMTGGEGAAPSATLTRKGWATRTMPAVFPDEVEVQLFSTTAGPQLVGALYTTAYHPHRASGGDQIDLWAEPMALGESLPVQPLWLLNAGVIPVELNTTDGEALIRSRLP
jgi:hypothetical protein